MPKRPPLMFDAVVVGGGHNGLVAANILADAGWGVVVLEAADRAGGAVRTDPLTEPGVAHDVFSAFYPLAAASPVLAGMELERYGLRWRRSPLVVAHPTLDGRSAVLSTDIDLTARSLEAYAPSDGERWRELYALWERVGPALLDALMTPFPPIVDGARLARRVGMRDFQRFMRFLMLPMRRLADEQFRGKGGALLLAGNSAHTDLAPESPGSGFFGWLLCSLGQQYGFPVPEGGASGLVEALVRRLEERGGRVELSARVDRIVVRRRRAVAVRLADGRVVDARRAVLAAIDAPQLFTALVEEDHLPELFTRNLRHFEYDAATFKVDWLLDDGIPWAAEDARNAGTVHVAESIDELTVSYGELARGLVPSNPHLVIGQMTAADPTRAPQGQHTTWAYTSVPQRIRGDACGQVSGAWTRRDAEIYAQRIESRIEALAPSFRSRIRGRHILTPRDMQRINRSLVGGARNSGTSQIHQQLVFRPTPGLGRPETPIRRLYLASASAHPGGGVHGGPGAIAARAALQADRARRFIGVAGTSAALALAVRKASPHQEAI